MACPVPPSERFVDSVSLTERFVGSDMCNAIKVTVSYNRIVTRAWALSPGAVRYLSAAGVGLGPSDPY